MRIKRTRLIQRLLVGLFLLASSIMIEDNSASAPGDSPNKGKETYTDSPQPWTYDRLHEAKPRPLPEPREPYNRQQQQRDISPKQEQKKFDSLPPTFQIPQKQSLVDPDQPPLQSVVQIKSATGREPAGNPFITRVVNKSESQSSREKKKKEWLDAEKERMKAERELAEERAKQQ